MAEIDVLILEREFFGCLLTFSEMTNLGEKKETKIPSVKRWSRGEREADRFIGIGRCAYVVGK